MCIVGIRMGIWLSESSFPYLSLVFSLLLLCFVNGVLWIAGSGFDVAVDVDVDVDGEMEKK